MKPLNKLILLVLVIAVAGMISCNKNYYSGTRKGGGNCGCPSHKGMSGY